MDAAPGTEIDANACGICLADMPADLRGCLCPQICSHAFCAPCLTQWLRVNRTCPVCRADVGAVVSPTAPHRPVKIRKRYPPTPVLALVPSPPPPAPTSIAAGRDTTTVGPLNPAFVWCLFWLMVSILLGSVLSIEYTVPLVDVIAVAVFYAAIPAIAGVVLYIIVWRGECWGLLAVAVLALIVMVDTLDVVGLCVRWRNEGYARQ